MRKGVNQRKDVELDIPKFQHRVIIPLHIADDPYYNQSWEVFEMCLRSLRMTSVNSLVISVISNSSDRLTEQRLFDLYDSGRIDEIILVKDAIGKVNAILKALRTAEEPLITVTDGDVLFLNGWETAVLDVFDAFPKAAAVSPVPVFGTQARLTSNIWFDYFFSGKLKFRKVADPEAMTRFANSIGWPWLDKKYKEVILTLKGKDNVNAVVGCNHMTVTYRSEVFSRLPDRNSNYLLGGDSELRYLDLPPLFFDGYRLTTYQNFAYHLGNTIEDWSKSCFENLVEQSKQHRALSSPPLKSAKLSYLVKSRLFRRVTANSGFRKWFYVRHGLQKSQIHYFFNDKG